MVRHPQIWGLGAVRIVPSVHLSMGHEIIEPRGKYRSGIRWLTLSGAIALLGIGSWFGYQRFLQTIIQAPYTFSWQNAALSMVAAIGVGVGSSFFPALRATQIDVVAALRE